MNAAGLGVGGAFAGVLGSFIRHVANMRPPDWWCLRVSSCRSSSASCMQFHNRDAPNAPQLLQTPRIMRPWRVWGSIAWRILVMLWMKNDSGLRLSAAAKTDYLGFASFLHTQAVTTRSSSYRRNTKSRLIQYPVSTGKLGRLARFPFFHEFIVN